MTQTDPNVADERAAGFRAALDGKLNALRDVHLGDLLQEGLATMGIGFSFCSCFGKSGFVNGAAVQFVEKIFLVGGNGRRMFECRGEGGRIADAAEILEERLNSDGRKMLDDVDEEAGGTILILDERFTDAGLVGKVLGGVSEECGERFGPFDGLYEDVGRDGEQRFLGARRDDFVLVVREHGQDFRPVDGIHVRAGCTDSDLSLARSAAMAKLIYDFRA